MEELIELIATYEAKTGAQPFDMANRRTHTAVTREQMKFGFHPIAGG